MHDTSLTNFVEAAGSALALAGPVKPAGAQLIQVESSCFPFAEPGDILELHPGFSGDGLYALEYVRPTGVWSGLRQARQRDGLLHIQEPTGEWMPVAGEWLSVVKIVGRVNRVYSSKGELVHIAGQTH